MSGPVYVYFIQKGYGSIKIGVSSDPEARCVELQTGNHGWLYVLAKFPFKTRQETFAMEKALHFKFQGFRLHGEWFNRRILKEFRHRGKLFPNESKNRSVHSKNNKCVPVVPLDNCQCQTC